MRTVALATRSAYVSAVVASALLMPGTVADATPSRGVTGTVLAQITAGGHDVIVREITLAAGGSTGWHWHEGTLYARVKSGTLTHNGSDCTTMAVYPKGSAFIEPTGADRVHIGRNLGSTPVVLDVVYVLPAGAPLANDAADPGCGFD